MLRVLAFLAALVPLAAAAQQPSRLDVAARQVASLFLASCVQYAGQPAALRAWATQTKIPLLPAPGQAGFLKGAPGTVFDASNPAGKFVIVALDDGGCLVAAEAVNTAELVRATEAALAQAAITAVLDGDRADITDEKMRHRTYHAAAGPRGWTLVISFGPGLPSQAMLSAAAR